MSDYCNDRYGTGEHVPDDSAWSDGRPQDPRPGYCRAGEPVPAAAPYVRDRQNERARHDTTQPQTMPDAFERWLAAPQARHAGCSGAAGTGPATPPCLAALLEALPSLGPVLWLERPQRSHAGATLGTRGLLLLDHAATGALGRCAAVEAHTVVTPHGPREWLAFRDASGVTQNKLFVLPDSDYLAWDEMTEGAGLHAPADGDARCHPHRSFLRGAFARLGGGAWRAHLLHFHLKRLPWLYALGARVPLRISLLGLDVARAIARDEAAELVAPLRAS